MLATFAEHVGLAIADARAMDGLAQGFRDPLTGLASRALFNDRLAHALACAERDQTRTSVLTVDLDRFQGVNDSLGHAVGDKLLAAVGERLRGCVRTTDTVARLGADEFAMLLHDVELRDRAVIVASRVLQVLREAFPINGRDVVIDASIGIAFGAVGQQDAETLLQYADLALHTAKKKGKGRFEVFEPVMHATLKKGADLESDLRLAVDRGEFVLRYQPIVALHSSRVSGFEALVRWMHPSPGWYRHWISSRSRRKPASSCRSEPGCYARPAGRPRSGTAGGPQPTRCRSASTCPPANCSNRTCRSSSPKC